MDAGVCTYLCRVASRMSETESKGGELYVLAVRVVATGGGDQSVLENVLAMRSTLLLIS